MNKYEEKTKTIWKVYKKNRRKYRLLFLGVATIALIIFIISIPLFEKAFVYIWIGDIAIASTLGGILERKQSNNTQWYNHQISIIEKIQLENELSIK